MARAFVFVAAPPSPRRLALWRTILGCVFLAASFVAAIRAGANLYWTLGEQLCIAVGAALLADWQSEIGGYYKRRLLRPAIIGALLVVPIGIADGGDDYMLMWLILLPQVCAMAMFATRRGRRAAASLADAGNSA